jgi:hypothetical protein
MRRFFALILFALSLSLIYGHHAVYLLLNHRLDREWSVRQSGSDPHMLRQYQASWPVTLAYQPDQNEFVPSESTFELYGIHYRVIKQRYARDTLHVVYTPDIRKNRLDFSYRHFLRSIGGLEATGESLISCLKLMTVHYFPVTTLFNTLPAVSEEEQSLPEWHGIVYSVYGTVPSPPPKA